MLNGCVTDTVHHANQQLAGMIIPSTQDNDGVRGAQVDPVLGGEVVDREQLLDVIGDLGDGLGELGPVGGLEGLHGGAGVVLVLGVPDLGQRLLRPGMGGLGQRTEHIRDLVEPAALLSGLRKHLA
jgi:hypothetical protein